jgi:ESX secretion system protein EccD
MTASNVCRVVVQTQDNDDSGSIDLALPNGIALGEILPSVVDIVVVGAWATADGAARQWMMSRLDGTPLNTSMTLHENGVRDGELLLLTTAADDRLDAEAARDLCHAVIDAAPPVRGDQVARRLGAAAFSWAAGVGAVTLIWPVHAPVSTRAVIAALVALATAVGAIMASRAVPSPLPCVVLGMTAAAFAAVAGFLAVPNGPAPPNLLLAAVACSAVSIVLLRLTSVDPVCFTALATFTTVGAVAAAAVTLWPAPTATLGAMLSVVSLAMLGAAAKLAIALAGMSAKLWYDDEPMTADVPANAEYGHQTLTGLLTGFSASAAMGAVLVTAGQRDDSTISGAAFTAVVSTALLLRARQQAGHARFTIMFAAGMTSATTTFVLACWSAPQHAHWMCLVAITLGAGFLWVTVAGRAAHASPVVRRGQELAEYLALGSVVPLACWVADLFGVVRGLSLR